MVKVPLKELRYFVRNVLAAVHMQEKNGHAFLITLEGELGAGKTTFVQALAKELGIQEVVQSPTYVLMKAYTIPHDSSAMDAMGKPFTTLVHIDAYRLNSPQEFAALQPERIFEDPHTLVCLEWPERVEGVLPPPDLAIKFSSETAGESERFIELV